MLKVIASIVWVQSGNTIVPANAANPGDLIVLMHWLSANLPAWLVSIRLSVHPYPSIIMWWMVLRYERRNIGGIYWKIGYSSTFLLLCTSNLHWFVDILCICWSWYSMKQLSNIFVPLTHCLWGKPDIRKYERGEACEERTIDTNIPNRTNKLLGFVIVKM